MNEEEFGIEDIQTYEEALEQNEDEWDEEDIEDTINCSLPNLLDFLVLAVVSIPIVLVLWLGMKLPPLAIGAAIIFSCIFAYTLYRFIKSRKIKGIVLPELKSKAAVHFHKICVSVTDNYLVTWSVKKLKVFKLCEVESLGGKKGMQRSPSAHKFDDLLFIKRSSRKAVEIVGTTVSYTEIDKVNKLIKERKQESLG